MKALDKIQKPEDREQKTDTAKKATNKQSVSPHGKGKKVEGYEMQDVSASVSSSAPIPYLFIAGFLLFILLLISGWKKK